MAEGNGMHEFEERYELREMDQAEGQASLARCLTWLAALAETGQLQLIAFSAIGPGPDEEHGRSFGGLYGEARLNQVAAVRNGLGKVTEAVDRQLGALFSEEAERN